MPAFLVWLLAGIGASVGEWVIKALVSAGIGVVTYQGIDTSLNFLKAQVLASAFALGPQIVGLLATLKVGQCINIIFSAIAVRFVLNGVSSGRFKKFVLK